MTGPKLAVDCVLLFIALENLLFIIKYASFSQWNKTWLGRSIMIQKSIMTLICVMFPVNSFLMLSDDANWFRFVEIVLLGLFVIALAVDFLQLFDVQRSRLVRTLAFFRRLFGRESSDVETD